jgi:hypothetical protein
MKHSLKAWMATAGAAVMALPVKVLAQSPFERAQEMTKETAEKANISSDQSLTQIVGSIINSLLGFLGIIFLVLMIYAGFLWMTARGDEGQTKKARDMIFQAVIGLVIVVAAFAISNFVLGSLVNVSQ